MLVVLLDLHRKPDPSQECLLAAARALAQSEDFSVLLVCPACSFPALEARVQRLPHIALGSDRPLHPLSLLRLWFCLRKHRRVLFQSFGDGAAALGRMLVRMRKPGSSLLVHAHFFEPRLQHSFFQESYDTAERVICGSGVIAQKVMRASGAPPGKICIIPPSARIGAYPERAYPKRAERNTGRFILCMPGALEEGRGQQILIQAMAALWQVEDLPPWEMRLIGEGSLFHSLLEEARKLGVVDRLAVLGGQDLREMLPQCDALLLPSGEAVYSSVLAAGWTVGVPVVCPDLPACREMTRHEENALFFTPDNPQALAAAILRLIREPDTVLGLVRGGRAALTSLNEERMTERCFELYHELLAGYGRSAGAAAPAVSAGG